MKIRCVIIDDEPIARKGLKDYTDSIDFLEVVAVCKNAMEANMVLKKEKVDLLFLDIEMPLLSGMEFLKSLAQPPKVIFTTAYSEYAVDSFAFDVIDYLLKPISFNRFLQAANKAYRIFDKGTEATAAETVKTADEQEYIFVKVDKELVKVKYSEILFVQGMQNYVNIVCENSTKMVLIPLKNVLDELPEDKFIQVQKSYIVSIDKVDAISGNQLLIGKHKIPLSRNLKDQVIKVLMSDKVLKK